MPYRTTSALLAAVIVVVTAVPCRADISYNLVDNPVLTGNQVHIAGTITTNGATGTIGASNITAWSVTVSSADYSTSFSFSGSSASGTFNLVATATSITLSPNTVSAIVLQTATEAYSIDSTDPGHLDNTITIHNNQFYSNYTAPYGTFAGQLIAGQSPVPEPSSFALMLGAAGAFAVGRSVRARFRCHSAS
jgi:hypothetical protein